MGISMKGRLQQHYNGDTGKRGALFFKCLKTSRNERAQQMNEIMIELDYYLLYIVKQYVESILRWILQTPLLKT